MRTLRIPDTEQHYNLPPGLGHFPLRHTEDYAKALPRQTTDRGGVILPMWQAEAMWIRFKSNRPSFGIPFPVAIKVAAGKINAVSGEPWRHGLHRMPQDYMVCPRQPWLDGYAIEKGIIRQFVAMPLGEGYTAEEQITGEAEWGGLQISVTPLKAKVWSQIRAEYEEEQRRLEQEYKERERRRENEPIVLEHRSMRPLMARRSAHPLMACGSAHVDMGLAPGGRMKQAIYPDPHDLDSWDVAATDRVFVTLVHAKDWKSITGDAALPHPPTAEQYTRLGLPWFDYYDSDKDSYSKAVSNSANGLAKLKSLGGLFKAKTGTDLPDSGDVNTPEPIVLTSTTGRSRPVVSREPEA
jgi:hypothetical protein